jgi:hypothetical protein
MKPALIAIVGLSLVALDAGRLSSQDPARARDFQIVVGARFGPVQERTTHAELTTRFGRAAVLDTDISIGEGFCAPGTRVFVGTPDEIDITWQDAERSTVAFVRATKSGGRWVTPRGVRVGTPLTQLEQLAGAPVTFSGFGWDYGGGLEWKESGSSIGLRLAIESDDAAQSMRAPEADAIYGDKPVRSDHPLVRRLRIRVDEITQTWGPHHGERDCEQVTPASADSPRSNIDARQVVALEEMIDAVNAGDAKRYANPYAPDAVVTIYGAPRFADARRSNKMRSTCSDNLRGHGSHSQTCGRLARRLRSATQYGARCQRALPLDMKGCCSINSAPRALSARSADISTV